MADYTPPLEITLWHCPTCNSVYRFNLGSMHIPNVGGTSTPGKCPAQLKPARYFH